MVKIFHLMQQCLNLLTFIFLSYLIAQHIEIKTDDILGHNRQRYQKEREEQECSTELSEASQY